MLLLAIHKTKAIIHDVVVIIIMHSAVIIMHTNSKTYSSNTSKGMHTKEQKDKWYSEAKNKIGIAGI